jgi:hypothetical protein
MTMILSWIENKYITIVFITNEVVLLKYILQYLVPIPTTIPKHITLNCDNQSCILLTETPCFHDHTKHIELQYHFYTIRGEK